MNQPLNSERPFQPFEVLRRKPIPSSQMGVLIKLHKKEDIGEPDIKVEKITINDRRKHSSVERKLILDKLRQNKAFGVNIEQKVEKTKPSPEELLSIPIPIGEPTGTFSKIDEIIIEEEKAKEDELDKVLDEAIQVETNEEVLEDELAELNDILNQDKELVEKETVVIPVEEEIIMEAPIAEKPKAKRGRKAKVALDEPLINVDLKTAKIREQLVSDMLPKPTEKVIIKAPAYYMNNRKLYVQKLNELFQPYRKEIMADETGISCEARQDNKEFELLTHQKIVRDYLNLYTPYRGLLLYHGLGSGKCHKKDTPIMMSDGTIKMVQDILVGDLLMGDDSTPRTVLSLAKGRDKMYDIIPVKGDKYTVNQEHILCLRASGFPKLSYNNHKSNTHYNIQWIENNIFQSKTFTFNEVKNNKSEMKLEAEKFFENIKANKNTSDNILEISVNDYLKLSDKKKGFLKGYKVPIEFPEKELPIDPYMIGYWLGDGASRGASITSQDSTVLYYFAKNLPKYGLTLNYKSQYDYNITGNGKKHNNIFINTLNDLNLIQNKHIPLLYKCNSRDNRLKLLAGLIDSDGSYSDSGFEFTQKNETLMDDVIYLARSLGFSCYKSKKQTSWSYKGIKKEGIAYRIFINGVGVEKIPTKIPRKQAFSRRQIKDVLVNGINVEYVGEDDYYGFTLDANCRYLMGDFTVTHNTASSIAIAEGMKSDKRIFVLTPASLKMNFFSELKNNGDHLYRKNQYWEFVSIDGKPEYISILSKALSIPVESIRNRGGAWLVNIQKEANFADKNADEQKEIDDQLNEMIRSKYVDINYNGINKKGFQKLVNDLGANPFDNSVVIIDEAHNFVSRIVNKIKKKTSLSYTMYELLMNATNARVVLLTGTPIINYPNEIGILFNILRGYIKTWSMTVNVKTSDKITTDTILDLFDKARFKTYDYVEYSGNKLTITRNPFGFVNTKKRGVVKGTQRKPKQSGGGEQSGGFMETIFGGKKTKSNKPKGNKTTAKKYDTIVDKITFTRVEDEVDAEKAYRVGYNGENEPHMGGGAGEAKIGGGPVADSYNGVHLDETGNLSDAEFQNTIINILKQNGLEVPTGSIEVKKYKALPDEPEPFLNLFVNGNGDVENIDVFKRRILGLTSYFRSAQEQLLPRFEKTTEGDIFHIIKSELTPYQFGVYEKIRKVEAEQEKKNKKNQKKAQNAVDNDLYKISSTYRIFSRAACNFVFPPGIDRPMPDKKNKEEIDENDLNAVSLSERIANDEIEEEEQANIDTEVVSYQKRINNALDELAYKPEREREQEYLIKEQLGQYSPKFVKLLENVQSEQNQGSHLIYSQFRTIEGIGILKLIFEANGYAEFKIQKKSDGIWDIVENPQAIDKPKFVLYTGTETAEEKEIIRNIYNSNWKFVPASIVTKLQEQHPNNFMGEVIKVFMITSSGAEGINLKNTRYVHIVEPYWHMVRIEQVIGRARRICSHQDLPEELRTVKVFLYISTLSEEQKTSEENVELRIRDVSKLDHETPVTTDETLFETASIKDKVNRQILKAVKESAMDCSLYSAKNKDEPLVCYGYGKVESNQFGSYPALEQDRSEKTDLNVRTEQINMIKISYKGKDYALNERTNELFDYESYLRAKDTGSDILLVGHLIKDTKGMRIELLEEKQVETKK